MFTAVWKGWRFPFLFFSVVGAVFVLWQEVVVERSGRGGARVGWRRGEVVVWGWGGAGGRPVRGLSEKRKKRNNV